MYELPISLDYLRPEFLRYDKIDTVVVYHHVKTLKEAQGMRFLDPLGFIRNNGIKGTSSIVLWFLDRRVPTEASPLARWRVSGTGLMDLTLDPSIDCTRGGALPGRWHGWIKGGMVS